MSNTKLKIIALCAMLIDHIGQFIPETPTWFNWIGRIAAPIFIYCIVLGLKHTKDKKKYITRLYILSLGMAAINMILNQIFNSTYFYIWNNFFSSLFLVAVTIILLENFKVKYLFLFIFWQISSFFLCFTLAEKYQIFGLNYGEGTYYFWGSVFGNVLFVEGSFLGISLGVIFYLTRFNRVNLSIFYSLFVFGLYLVHLKLEGYANPIIHTYFFPFAEYQWMMIFALPFILVYNGSRGVGLKYLFYIFYPAHLIALYLIALYRM